MNSPHQTGIADHYRQPGLLEQILGPLNNQTATPLTFEALAGTDEFHTGGARATEFAMDLLPLTKEMRVLDVGCGIGGAARRIATRFGCPVSGIDLTNDFVQTAIALTERMRLSSACDFQVGCALRLPYPDRTFDATVCFHVAMNIEERRDFYTEVQRVTKPDGWFLSYDLVRGPNSAELTFPLPWSDSPDHSFLLTSSDTETVLTECGFVAIQRHQLPELDASQQQEASVSKTPNVLLGENAAQKVRNHKAAISDQRIVPEFFLARRNPSNRSTQ